MYRASPTISGAQSYLRNILEFGCSTLRARGRVISLIHGYPTEGPEIALGCFFDDNKNKDQAIAMLRALFVLRDVRYYIFMSEAWMTVNPKVAENGSLLTPPSLDPNRIEIIQALIMTARGGMTGRCEFHRDKDGAVSTILPPIIDTEFAVGMKGRFASLLDGNLVSTDDLAAARAFSKTLPIGQLGTLQ